MGRASAAERGYDADWRALRLRVLDERPWCRLCGRRATVVDHVIPVRLAPELRLERRNLQPLCKRCHDSTKQQQETNGYARDVDARGYPVDPKHPANRA